MSKPLVPRDWKTTQAILLAKKPDMPPPKPRGREISAFNGSQKLTSETKKRPITLPDIKGAT